MLGGNYGTTNSRCRTIVSTNKTAWCISYTWKWVLSFGVALEAADSNEWLSLLFSCVTLDKFSYLSNPCEQWSEKILTLLSFPSFLSYLFIPFYLTSVRLLILLFSCFFSIRARPKFLPRETTTTWWFVCRYKNHKMLIRFVISVLNDLQTLSDCYIVKTN